MSSDKRNITAIALCVVFYLIYTQYLRVKYPNMDQKPVATQSTGDTPNASSTAPGAGTNAGFSTGRPVEAVADEVDPAAPEAPAIEQLSQEELTVTNKTSRYVFDQKSGGIKSLVLTGFRQDPDNASAMVDLIDKSFLLQGTVSTDQVRGYRNYNAERQGSTVRFWKRVGVWEVSHTYVVPEDGFGLEFHVAWKNLGEKSADLNASVLMAESVSTAEEETAGGFLPGMPTARPHVLNHFGADEMVREDLLSYCSDTEPGSISSVRNTTVDFYGFDKHYFQKVLLPETKNLSLDIRKLGLEQNSYCNMVAMASQSQGLVSPGQTVNLKFRGWFGPKILEEMQAYDVKLEQSMDLGWFDFLARPLFSATAFAHDVTGNWGIAIILITLALKILFFPLNKQAAVSMKRMQKLQPEMTRIREKYKDDKQTQQQELMKFMSVNKINPMKGCLPILPQMPIFFAFYRLLGSSVELRHAPFFAWISDLSAADPFYVTPLLLGAAMFAQQKLTPTTTMDPAQAKMMLMMPLIFTVMMLSLPAGLVLYMLTNTVVSVAQQQWLNRRLA